MNEWINPIDTTNDTEVKGIPSRSSYAISCAVCGKAVPLTQIEARYATFRLCDKCINAINAVRNILEVSASAAPVNQSVQIQKFDSVLNTNKFLKNIPKENVIEIKPLENNTYLVIYSEEKK